MDAQGKVRNEGDVEVGVSAPYPVGYRAILPKKRECANLLVPICLSASHIAYGSIRMEPVFMVLGQSSATAAALALRENVAVQDVDEKKLRDRLLADGQIYASDPARAAPVQAAKQNKSSCALLVTDICPSPPSRHRGTFPPGHQTKNTRLSGRRREPMP